jgi:hypothetical protein
MGAEGSTRAKALKPSTAAVAVSELLRRPGKMPRDRPCVFMEGRNKQMHLVLDLPLDKLCFPLFMAGELQFHLRLLLLRR